MLGHPRLLLSLRAAINLGFSLIPLITHPAYSYEFPGNHRFPMEKFKLLHEYLIQVGIAQPENTFRPGKIRPELLCGIHCSTYVDTFIEGTLNKKQLRSIGLPWSKGLVERSLISPNGTLLTASIALKKGIACHLAGGTHHAHRDYGSGFCIFNDLAIAANTLVQRERANGNEDFRVLIFDVDVHQGDGTATTLQNQASAFTCSVHCASNFPPNKSTSDLDIEFNVDIEDDEYLMVVKSAFDEALSLSKPDLVLYDAGVDVYKNDPLGRANVSLNGIRTRDTWILERCKTLGVPVATVIGGGYDDDRMALAKRHAIVVEVAHDVYSGLD